MAPLRTFTALSLALAAQAFQVHFYQGSECRGAFDGTVQISLANNMCSTQYMGTAQSAIVDREAGDSLNDAVFWSGASNCDISNAVAESNGGVCIDFTGEAFPVDARSFEVISGMGGGAKKAKAKKSIETVSKDVQGKAERRDAIAEEAVTEDRPRGIWHGMDFEWNGQQYKWHQIFNETYSGVLVSEWNPAIHIANDADLPPATDEGIASWSDEDFSANPARRALMTLDERSFREDICRVAAVCTAVIYTAPSGLRAVGATGIDYAARAWRSQNRKTFWAFLNTPFVSQAITVGGSGYYVTLATKGTTAPTNCSTTGTTQGTLKDALNGALAGGDVDSLQMNITVGGRIYTVDIQAQPVNNHAAGQCGNVNPNP